MPPLLPGLTIIERIGWIHPDDIDISTFTFGTDYIHLYMESDNTNTRVNINKEGFPGGFHVAIPLAETDEIVGIQGLLGDNTSSAANLVKQFHGLHRKVNQPLTYLIIKTNDGAVGQYHSFMNQRDRLVTFAPGYLSNIQITYSAEERLYGVRGTFEVAWVV